MFPDIIYRPVYISKRNVSETRFCLRVQVKPTKLDPINKTSPYLRTPVPEVKVTLRLTVSQSVSQSWCRAPSGAHDQIFITCVTVTVLFLCDERTGLSFVYAAGP
jgi:hypothetical protein